MRVALQGFAAVCGGTQSLHTNGYDEALALPTEKAAKLALRTQQIIAHESGATDTIDPFAGSYYVEALTAEVERRASELIDKIDQLGGSVEAIHFIKNEIEESAFGYHERYRTGQDIVVGVNRYVDEELEVEDILRVDPESEREQVERLKAFKAARDGELTARRLSELQGGLLGRREPPAADPPGAGGPLLDRRGLRGDARGVRGVPDGRLRTGSTPARRQGVGLMRCGSPTFRVVGAPGVRGQGASSAARGITWRPSWWMNSSGRSVSGMTMAVRTPSSA